MLYHSFCSFSAESDRSGSLAAKSCLALLRKRWARKDGRGGVREDVEDEDEDEEDEDGICLEIAITVHYSTGFGKNNESKRHLAALSIRTSSPDEAV